MTIPIASGAAPGWPTPAGALPKTSSTSESEGPTSGPVMAYEALKHYSDRALNFRFVSNVDGTDFEEAVRDLDPTETLFVICSKTFTTLETMTNARAARAWSFRGLNGGEASVAKHFVAVSTNTERSQNSASIRPTCLNSGTGSEDAIRWNLPSGFRPCSLFAPDNFRAMLDGFQPVDQHFRHAPFQGNLPVLMGLCAVLA